MNGQKIFVLMELDEFEQTDKVRGVTFSAEKAEKWTEQEYHDDKRYWVAETEILE